MCRQAQQSPSRSLSQQRRWGNYMNVVWKAQHSSPQSWPVKLSSSDWLICCDSLWGFCHFSDLQPHRVKEEGGWLHMGEGQQTTIYDNVVFPRGCQMPFFFFFNGRKTYFTDYHSMSMNDFEFVIKLSDVCYYVSLQILVFAKKKKRKQRNIKKTSLW